MPPQSTEWTVGVVSAHTAVLNLSFSWASNQRSYNTCRITFTLHAYELSCVSACGGMVVPRATRLPTFVIAKRDAEATTEQISSAKTRSALNPHQVVMVPEPSPELGQRVLSQHPNRKTGSTCLNDTWEFSCDCEGSTLHVAPFMLGSWSIVNMKILIKAALTTSRLWNPSSTSIRMRKKQQLGWTSRGQKDWETPNTLPAVERLRVVDLPVRQVETSPETEKKMCISRNIIWHFISLKN